MAAGLTPNCLAIMVGFTPALNAARTALIFDWVRVGGSALAVFRTAFVFGSSFANDVGRGRDFDGSLLACRPRRWSSLVTA